MALQQISSLDNNPNQTWPVTGSINGNPLTLVFALNFNEVALLWELAIYDAASNLLISSLPLVTGLNLLAQFESLNIGSLYVINQSGVDPPDYPGASNLGTSFILAWGDNPNYVPGQAYTPA